jgi:tetratricopeptide (TPR) repeat protein
LHPNFDLSQLSNATFTSPVQLPKNVDAISVVIEELSTGAWGGVALPIARNQDVIATAGWTEGGVDPMHWLPWADALKEAQKVGKLIVQCAGCDEKIFADSTLRNTLNAFVVTNKPDAQPHVLLLDPWGHQRFDWQPSNAPDLVAKLRMAMSVGSALVQAGAHGDTPESHFSLGFAYLKTQAFAEAEQEYNLAEAGARAKGDAVLAQRAQIQSAAALGGQKDKRSQAIANLEKIVKAPQSPATEAEAWLILGHLRRGSGNEKGAREAYTNAAQRAPSGSDLQKVATKLASGT